VLGNSYDMRGGQSKKSDEAGKAIGDLGKGEIFPLPQVNRFVCEVADTDKIFLTQARDRLFLARALTPTLRLRTRTRALRITWILASGSRLDK